MINIILNGATGKMGRLAATHIRQTQDLALVAELSSHDDLAAAIKKYQPDIVLDWTTAAAAYQNTKTIIEHGATPVIGTSGLTAANISELQQLAKQHQVGGIIVPNFSISAVLMMQFATTAATYFDDISIVETHHPDKKDKPSGTARRTAEQMAVVKNWRYEDIAIESHRETGTVAKQAVWFHTPFESLCIEQNSFNRECFMPGMLLACRRATALTELVVGLDKIL